MLAGLQLPATATDDVGQCGSSGPALVVLLKLSSGAAEKIVDRAPINLLARKAQIARIVLADLKGR